MRLPQGHLQQARTLLEDSGVVTAAGLRPEIQASWQRCLEAGLDPIHPPASMHLNRDGLFDLYEHNAILRQVAGSELRRLYEQIAGSHFMIALADRDGVTLDLLADESFRNTAEASDLRIGTLWSETHHGTNALGTAAAGGQPVVVHAEEHFFRKYGHLTCAAAPVFDPHGEIVGILDATSDCRAPQHHTLVLVQLAARQIETALFTHSFPDALIIRLYPGDTANPTADTGMIALTEDGALQAVNRQARLLLDDVGFKPGQPFETLFVTSFAAFMDSLNHSGRVQLTDEQGRTHWVTADATRSHPSMQQSSPGAALRPSQLRTGPADFVHYDGATAEANTIVERAVRLNVPILIRGETGTGKEVLARYAHQMSGRAGPFVAVNCAALPESLIAAELFGYNPGAFTGARANGAPGLIRQADGGTLFLDEIGDMQPELQATLLRLLDDWTVRPVGATTELQVDIQLIVATNCDLEEAVQQQRFRADLLYRINTVEVVLPPLRDRSDFREMVEIVLASIDPEMTIAEAALQLLSQHRWDGNIRELKNVLTRLVLQAHGHEIQVDSVQRVLPTTVQPECDAPAPGSLNAGKTALVLEAYQKAGGNVSVAARTLGVSRNTVYQELRKAGYGTAARDVPAQQSNRPKRRSRQ